MSFSIGIVLPSFIYHHFTVFHHTAIFHHLRADLVCAKSHLLAIKAHYQHKHWKPNAQ
jgi:hypothetical protein